MTRLTDNDFFNCGPLTLGWMRAKWSDIHITFKTGDGEDPGNRLHLWVWKLAVRIMLPNILQPDRRDVPSVLHPGTTYVDETDRQYGFSYSDGFLNVYFGRQTHDSRTEQRWSCFLPWTQWRLVRHSIYRQDGSCLYTSNGKRDWEQLDKAKNEVDKAKFLFRDYDGAEIVATCYVEEREWAFGEKWCSWLSFFRKNHIRRSMTIDFSEEVWSEKGSWKGGTLGHGIDMLSGETCEDAFRRYCAKGHRGKYKNTPLHFLGVIKKNVNA